jgi:uncharacterized Zn-binding protein involved in type VI secretion
MTAGVHRNGDLRACGATTVVTGQSFVYANDKLISVNGDPNTHGSGGLSASTNNVFINGIAMVNDGDGAAADGLCPTVGGAHCAPSATTASTNLFVGD